MTHLLQTSWGTSGSGGSWARGHLHVTVTIWIELFLPSYWKFFHNFCLLSLFPDGSRQRIRLDGNKWGRFKVPPVSLCPEGFLKGWTARTGLTHQEEDRHCSVSLIFLFVVKNKKIGYCGLLYSQYPKVSPNLRNQKGLKSLWKSIYSLI